MAYAGLHPVVAIYATFMNRAFDQVIFDCALHRAGVTFVLDRAGITGDDGASHNGMWDISLLSIVPGISIAAPRDEATLREELGEALEVSDHPTVVRFPKGAVAAPIAAIERVGGVDVLRRDADSTVLLVSVGAFASLCLEVAERLADQGIGVTVIDPRWVIPVPDALVDLARSHRLVVTVEDNVRTGGVGSAVSSALRAADVDVPCRDVGIAPKFLEQASRVSLLAQLGLTAQDISRGIVETVARFDNVTTSSDDRDAASDITIVTETEHGIE
jgi:1-deoxy-D-xylulose-5-phosphate synthase